MSGSRLTLSSTCSINKDFFNCFPLGRTTEESCTAEFKLKRGVNYLKGKRRQGEVNFEPRKFISEDSVRYFKIVLLLVTLAIGKWLVLSVQD